MSMKEEFLQAGVKEDEIGSWCSDLYVKVTQTSKKVIDNYAFKCNVTTFTSAIDGTAWYDIPFAYQEYHKR